MYCLKKFSNKLFISRDQSGRSAEQYYEMGFEEAIFDWKSGQSLAASRASSPRGVFL